MLNVTRLPLSSISLASNSEERFIADVVGELSRSGFNPPESDLLKGPFLDF